MSEGGKTTYVVDGEQFASLAELAAHFSEVVFAGHRWNGNFDALDDMLDGGFGTPENGYVLVWKRHRKSKRDLGHKATARWLSEHLATCHPDNRPSLQRQLAAAERRKGDTLFDWIVEIIEDHDDIDLRLK